MSMHNTNPSPSQKDSKQPSRFLNKKTVSRSESVVQIPANIVEAFFSSLPPTETVYYIREINVTPLLSAISASPFRTSRAFDKIPVGTSLLITHIEQNFYDEDTSVTPSTFELLEPDSPDGVPYPILLSIYANNVALFESNFATSNRANTTPTDVESGTSIRGRNILGFGQHPTALFVLEDSDLSVTYSLYKGTVGRNVADYATVRIKGFKLPTKSMLVAREKFGF